MARRASGRLIVLADVNEESDSLGTGDAIARMAHRLEAAVNLANGTSNGQIDRIWSTNGTATSTPTDFDLSGSLSSPLAAGAVTFAEVAFILVQNTGAANLTWGQGAASNPVAFWSGTNPGQNVLPGGLSLAYFGEAGLTIANASSDVLRLSCASTTTYRLMIAGRSA